MKSNSPYPPSVDPGFPELSLTPERWRRTTFGEVLEVVTRPLQLDSNAKYRLVNAKRNRGGIALRAEVLGREVLTKTQFEAKAGDFLISRRQIVHGACGVVPDELDGAVVSNEYSTLRTRPTLLMEFLRHYSHTPYFQRSCFHSSHGVTVEKMIFKLDEWLAREVDVPPLPEQRKIAAILSAVDEVIEKCEAMIESLQALKKEMMQELLTRGFPGAHIRFKQTEIGELPEEWEVRPLAEVGHVQTGIAKGKVTTRNTVTVPYLRVANVQDGYLDLAQLKTIEVEAHQIDRYRLFVGDVLFTEGGDADKLGRGCVWSGEIDLCIHQNHVFAVRVDRDRVVPQFLALFGASPVGKAYFMEAAKQTTNLASINSTQLKALPVPVPPIDEQREIVRGIDTCTDRIERERSCADAARRTKVALMSALLSGELRVIYDEGAA